MPNSTCLLTGGSDPGPAYYPYPPATRPHPFMGLGKFVAGRIYQMRSGRSYLAAHTSWENPVPDPACPCYLNAPQKFEHAILTCPSTAQQRSRLLQGVSDLGPQAPVWTDQQLLIDLAEFIHVTSTGFPPGMPPLPCLLQPPPPLSPSSLALSSLPCVLESGFCSPYISFVIFSCSATHWSRWGYWL